jgi:Universal stress protein UspA and related nucleotide-binding proteins
MGWSRILVPVDGSANAFKAAQQAIDLAKCCEAELEFLHVVNLTASLGIPSAVGSKEKDTSVLEDAIDHGRKILDQLLDLVPPEVKAKGHCVSGSTEKVILQEAEASRCDLIVMGSRGLGALRAVLVGSISCAVLNNASCSVMLIKADKK